MLLLTLYLTKLVKISASTIRSGQKGTHFRLQRVNKRERDLLRRGRMGQLWRRGKLLGPPTRARTLRCKPSG